jgi:cell division protein FtsB
MARRFWTLDDVIGVVVSIFFFVMLVLSCWVVGMSFASLLTMPDQIEQARQELADVNAKLTEMEEVMDGQD